jgi:3-methylcrotonyl-CoA carboxylase alpha subunit
MFEKILIANRGEIACRIIKTARKLGITSVVVYSDADKNSQAVRMADEAYYIGKAPSSESYLHGDKIIKIAHQTGAQAVHPGYGFLSENAEFAKACEEAGIIFIGPPPSAIETMGSKSAAKQIVESSNVPVTPGYHGKDQNPDVLLSEACRIGFPVLIKATAGGGGKGMRAVFNEEEFADALAGAKREALASFGDEEMLIEKYLVEPRHVEIQIFCDHHGNAVYLFERDCSIQRRHQKIIEEAPAPHFKDSLREAMGKAAVQAAKSIGYVGAGTIEFLLDQDEKFYFMEMNTRLQVEHPVTEMITKQDLVEWQLKVASKQPLPLTQEDLKIHGHAIEVRIYAEDTDNQFLPSIGTLTYFQPPVENDYVRVDTGVVQNDTITPYYDPMMAKLIVFGENRDSAIRRLKQALEQYYVIGVKNNIAFLKKVIHLSDFKEGKLSTKFIEKHQDALSKTHEINESAFQAYLTLACLYQATDAAKSTDPWDQKDSWQMNLIRKQNFTFLVNNAAKSTRLEYHIDNIQAHHSAATDIITHYQRDLDYIRAKINDEHYEARIFKQPHQISLLTKQGIYSFVYYIPDTAFEKEDHGQQQLSAPMPGAVVALHVKVGDTVKSGQHLIVLEAMKMEHTLSAPYPGIIKEIYFHVGAQVADGQELMVIEASQ